MKCLDNENKLELSEYISAYLDYERVHYSVDLNGTDLTHIIFNAIEAFDSIMEDKE